MSATTRNIAVVAASSVVPQVELAAGIQRLSDSGFDATIHSQCAAAHFTFAGTDVQRCGALWEAASDDTNDVVWLARGGYGAGRLLPMLEELTRRHGPPPKRKLLVGYSDVTVLHEYVRCRWGWSTLHAPMPSAPDFGTYDATHWHALLDLVRGVHPGRTWGERPLKWLGAPVEVEAELVGGNLALWASIVGTPFAPTSGRGRFVFFEDIGEKYYRIDRMLMQVRQAGLLDGVAAVLLGDFTNCDDDPPYMVRGPGETKVPLRRACDWSEAEAEIFGTIGVPVARGLPVGHGPNFAPLPLGARYRVGRDGAFELVEWDWLGE